MEREGLLVERSVIEQANVQKIHAVKNAMSVASRRIADDLAHFTDRKLVTAAVGAVESELRSIAQMFEAGQNQYNPDAKIGDGHEQPAAPAEIVK